MPLILAAAAGLLRHEAERGASTRCPPGVRPRLQEMLDTDGPYVLDVMVPHQEHVLPMIPGGGSFADTITEGDGRRKY